MGQSRLTVVLEAARVKPTNFAEQCKDRLDDRPATVSSIVRPSWPASGTVHKVCTNNKPDTTTPTPSPAPTGAGGDQ